MRYDILLTQCDIFASGKYEIISVPSYAEGIYHRMVVRYHTEGISPVPQGTDIIENTACIASGVFWQY